MTNMIAEVYDAFLAGGTPEDKARLAAQALSAEQVAARQDVGAIKEENQSAWEKMDKRIEGLEQGQTQLQEDVTGLQKDVAGLQKDVQELRSDMRLGKWMIGFDLALTVAILWKIMNL